MPIRGRLGGRIQWTVIFCVPVLKECTRDWSCFDKPVENCGGGWVVHLDTCMCLGVSLLME